MERDIALMKGVVVVLVVAVLAALVDAAILRRQLGAFPKEPRVLEVEATAYAEAEPDMAKVSLGVKAVCPTPQEAAAQVAKRVGAVKAKLAGLGVAKEAVETSELYVGEATQYDYKKGREVRLGYKAYHWLRVTLKRDDFAKLAAVCDGAVAAGATSLSDLRFEMEDDNALRAQALAKATTRAREKAEAMASAAQARIVGIHRISEGYTRGWGYAAQARAAAPAEMMEAQAPAMAAAEAPAGEAEVPGKLRIDCNVDVAFLLRS